MEQSKLLKFFEKNEIETGSVSVITIDGKGENQLKDTGGSYEEATKKDSSFRAIQKELVRYDKFLDGESFQEPFKINEISRGQAETSSRATGSAVTKSLTATFTGTGTIQRSPVVENISYNFSVPRLRLEPILDASITDSDGETTTRLANGFNDPNYSVIHNIMSLNLITTAGSSVNVFDSDSQINESKVEDIDETFTTPKTATVRYTDSEGDIVHEEVSMDLPYRLTGETWEVFSKVGVALREHQASRFVSQIMRQTIELRGVDLEMQLDPNLTILPNMTDFDPRPFTISTGSASLVFRNRTGQQGSGANFTDNIESLSFPRSDDQSVNLHYDVYISYTITASGKASADFSTSGVFLFATGTIRSVTDFSGGFRRNWNLNFDDPVSQSSTFGQGTTLSGLKAGLTSAATGGASNTQRFRNQKSEEVLRQYNAQNWDELVNRLIVNLQDNAIRQRTPFDAPDNQIYNVNTTATTTTGQNIGTHDLRDLALPSFKARPFEVTGGTNKTLGTTQVLLNRVDTPLLTNQAYSPSSVETFIGSASEEARKQKLGFQDLVNFDPDVVPLVDRQGRALSRELINENFLPITATKTINGASVTFSLVSIDKDEDTDSLSLNWERSDGADVTDSSLEGLTYRMLRSDGTIRTESIRAANSSILIGFLTFVFPNFTDFGDTSNIADARENLYSDAVNVAIDFSGASAGEGEQTIGFSFDSIDAFPDVSIDLEYLESSNQLQLILNRNSEFAPIPDKAFFDSMTINNRTFNFSGSSYSSDEDTGNATYLFASSTPPISDTAETFNVSFSKSGQSFTRAFDIERVVRKSTIRQEQSKELPRFLGGFKVEDISFDDENFTISFNETEMTEDSFSSLQIIGADGREVTRQLKASDAVITNENTFAWTNLSEFTEIKKNKNYMINMVKGANETEPVLFVPKPSGDFSFVTNVKYENNTFSFDIENFTSQPLTTKPINSVGLLQGNTNVIPQELINNLIVTGDGDKRNIAIENQNLNLSNGTYNLRLEVEDLPELLVQITQMTDLVFDTLIVLDTNLTGLFLKDVMNRDLIHPSDVKEIKEVKEQDGSRHLMISLASPIVTPVLKIISRETNDKRKRRLGQLFLLKSIGKFKEFPAIEVNVDSEKTQFKTQLNKFHVKTLPESLGYNLNFAQSPLDSLEDIKLAQDLFSRVSDYNEFIIWVNGGNDISEFSQGKFSGLKGFRFRDIVKALVTNNFSFRYAQDRLSSGATFMMQIKEVP